MKPSTQKTGMWCWLTVGEMIFNFYNVPNINRGLYQCSIVGVLFPAMCGQDCSNCAAVGGASGNAEFLTRMLTDYPKAANKPPINSNIKLQPGPGCPLTEKEIKAEIDAGRPIIAGISTSGIRKVPPEHVALIIGYEVIDGKLSLRINDPYPFPVNDDPYKRAGGEKNCNGSYSIPLEAFCNKFAWNVVWTGIQPAAK